MYAIVEIAGQQLKVEKNQKVFVHRLEAKEGSSVTFDKVLLTDNEGKVEVGMPTVKDIVVSAKVVSHLKGDKVTVFKKKRRKSYQKENGHRQYLTQLLIEDIKAATKNAATKKEAETKEVKAEKEATTEKKATAPKKEATKATTEKKAAPKKAAETNSEEVKKAAPVAKKATTKKVEDKPEKDTEAKSE